VARLSVIKRSAAREVAMDADQKKTALRMIPYGLYVLTAQDRSGGRTAATVN
jgi:flavin reductase (DIM6/NTAB) family NADH-FMN oxidoreductase RutF